VVPVAERWWSQAATRNRWWLQMRFLLPSLCKDTCLFFSFFFFLFFYPYLSCFFFWFFCLCSSPLLSFLFSVLFVLYIFLSFSLSLSFCLSFVFVLFSPLYGLSLALIKPDNTICSPNNMKRTLRIVTVVMETHRGGARLLFFFLVWSAEKDE